MNKTALAGKRILIGGGTGDVGVEIVASLLAAGAEVVALVRSRERAADLGTHPDLTIVEGFPKTDAEVASVREDLAALGSFDGAIASLGPWHHGPRLIDLPRSDWDHMVQASLTSHYLFARVAIPGLLDGGQYLMINGGAALSPVPSSGIVSILACGQTMIAQVLAAEHPTLKVQTLLLLSIIATRARTQPDPSWVTAQDVGETCVALLGTSDNNVSSTYGHVFQTTLPQGTL